MTGEPLAPLWQPMTKKGWQRVAEQHLAVAINPHVGRIEITTLPPKRMGCGSSVYQALLDLDDTQQ